MGSTLKHAPQQWSNESGNRQSSEIERPANAVAAEDVFDDPSILDELAEANASLSERSFATSARPLPARLPPVDAFDLDEACRTNEFEEASRAKSLAHRLGPPGHDEPEPRRRRNRLSNLGRRRPIVTPAAPRSSRGAFFWGFCTSLAIIIAVPTVFGFVLPLSNPPPAAIGDDTAGATATAPAVEPEVSIATETADVERRTNETIAVRKQPVAAGIIAPATTAFAAPLGPPTAPDEGFRPATAAPEEPAEGAAAVIDLNRPATKLEPVVVQVATPSAEPEAVDAEVVAPTAEPEIAAAEIAPPVAEPEPVAVETTPPIAAPEAPAAQADQADPVPPAEIAAPPPAAGGAADDDFTRMAQSQLSASANPSATTGFESTPDQHTSTGQPHPALSGGEIDRLLARGEELLRNGNIVSARMLFLHIAAAGDARGAKAVGMTYDPEVYARLPVTGLTPDRAEAEIWYEKAGDQTAYTIDLRLPEAAVDEEALALRERHAACARKYVSYDRNTGLYVARSGSKRPCELP